MDNDVETIMNGDAQEDHERQNRRQFFNGLGKWSLAIIAAVTSLRERWREVPTHIGSRDAPHGGPETYRPQIAKKKGPHGDQPHLDDPGFSNRSPHEDYYRIMQ